MYIHKVKIPSHVYAKHQYMQESEYRSIVIIYIPVKWYKYIVITERDLILHEYYITKRSKNMIYKEIYKEYKLEGAYELQGISQEPVKRRLEEKKLRPINC